MVRLLGFGGIIKGPFQPTEFWMTTAPLVSEPFVFILVEVHGLFLSKGIFVANIAINLFHEESVGVFIIAIESEMSIAGNHLILG